MKTELQFLEYLEQQIISSGEKVYTAWLRSEINNRKQELDGMETEKIDQLDDLRENGLRAVKKYSLSELSMNKTKLWADLPIIYSEENVKEFINKLLNTFEGTDENWINKDTIKQLAGRELC